ncbi:basic leucine zipper transcription factor domain-containing protein [Diplodia corticola]|uniref:Basic leucine zipper transcription factor domain-containing protein n=1 Tax=Diplodia corticola TaxID=236234 RepID=A0A1J9RU83_9PEZI|nr:basic leucine zipper transcription factor domain-containing protein [Diplodia corticola]OJD31069.1 basic leucine zipper transcription factor domain-containing protein [Diplodia corticola]
MSQGGDRGGAGETSSGEPWNPSSDDWAQVQDPTERRKIQNKLAQRKYRQKAKDEREEKERTLTNQQLAGGAYSLPGPGDYEQHPGRQLSGLPWGGLSMSHIVESGKSKEQSSYDSSRETSVYASRSRTGGSSRQPSSKHQAP